MNPRAAVPETLLAPIGVRRELGESTTAMSAGAFEVLVRTHQRQIYRILLLQLHDADAAESLTQECFLRAYVKRHDFRGEASVGTWLIRIALNLARDHVKSRRLAFWRRLGRTRPAGDQPFPDAVPPDPNPSAERHLIARERLAAVWSRVNHLPDRQRTCFLLRFAEDMPLEQIARVMQLEVGTVKAHLARAVGAVRRHLQEQEQSCTDI